MTFEKNLSNGIFLVPECSVCKKIIWPPTEICNYCLGQVSLKKPIGEGKIIEFSSNDDGYFCMVEFEKTIRIMARIVETPKIGQSVKIQKCAINERNYSFTVI